jgi:hypothetical protein
MTGDPILTFPETRDPWAETAIEGGLAAFNKEKFGRVDSTDPRHPGARRQ